MSHAEDDCAYCCRCGTRFLLKIWPRECLACGHVIYQNALAAVALIVPVGAGVLCIERAPTASHAGGLALCGGHVERQTWQEAAVAEFEQEVGPRLDVRDIALFTVRSTEDRRFTVVFARWMRSFTRLPDFTPNVEVARIFVADRPIPLCFKTHTEALQLWFDAKRPPPK